MKEKECARRRYLADRNYPAAVTYGLWRLLAGYGESISHWVVSSLIVLLGFAILYRWSHSIGPIHDWFDYVYFSVITFTSLGYGDIHPTKVLGEMLASLEITGGLLMFGLFITILSSRLTRE